MSIGKRFPRSMRHDDPRADNLLSRLFSYSPRPGREPLEDYCTEALAWCLINSETFQKRFLNELAKRLGHKAIIDCSTRPDVETQYSFKLEGDGNDVLNKTSEGQQNRGGRLDMVILPNPRSFVIAFESKVTAGFGESQLEKYDRELQKGRPFGRIPYWLVTITNDRCKPSKAKGHVTW
jgi:hypothetical protein